MNYNNFLLEYNIFIESLNKVLKQGSIIDSSQIEVFNSSLVIRILFDNFNYAPHWISRYAQYFIFSSKYFPLNQKIFQVDSDYLNDPRYLYDKLTKIELLL